MRANAFAELGPGWFASVALYDGYGYMVARVGDPRVEGIVRVWRWPGLNLSRIEVVLDFFVPAGSPAFPVITAEAGKIWIAYHDGTIGHLWALGGEHVELRPCENNQPICVGGGYIAWQGSAAQGWPVTRMRLANGEVATNVRNGQGTGLSRVTEDGTVITIDEDRFRLPGATIPSFADDLSVGEGSDRGIIWQLGADRGVLWPALELFVPDCDADAEKVAVVAAGPGGIQACCLTRDELRTQIPEHPKPDEPLPEPQPTPEPQPEPEPEPDMADVFETLKTARAKYSTPMSPEQLGALLNEVAWAHRGEGVGLEKKTGGANVPQPRTGVRVAMDILRFPGNVGRDVLGDADGQAVPGWGDPGPADPATFVAPVEPEGAVDPGDPGQPGEPGQPDPALTARVMALETRGAALERRVTALESTGGGGTASVAAALFKELGALFEDAAKKAS